MLVLSRSWFVFTKRQMELNDRIAVDILGFPLCTHCTKANVSDDQGLIEMLTQNIDTSNLNRASNR
jgi:hypothetical protein